MRTLCVLLAFVAAAAEESIRWTFEDATVGQAPQNWTAAKTGEGEGSVWKVLEDASAPKGSHVLAQTAEGPGTLYNLCVADETRFQDVEASVALKAVEGKTDQGGGILWRYTDANNYYVARVNPLESNFRVYKVVAGKRTQLATAKVEAAAGTWHTMRILQKGNHIQCLFNERLLLDVKDDTFKDAGKLGLWTKADAVTYFDDFHVRKPGE
jgi:hypothetical protein